MNKKLETALRCGRSKTDPPADISAEKNIPQLPHDQGQRHPSPLPASARQQLAPSPLPTCTSPIIRNITTNTKKSKWQRGEKNKPGKKWKFKLPFIHEKLHREKTKGRRKPRQAVQEKGNLVINECEVTPAQNHSLAHELALSLNFREAYEKHIPITLSSLFSSTRPLTPA